MTAVPDELDTDDLKKPELRTLLNYKKWTPEIAHQPEFGAELDGWMHSRGLDRKQLSEQVNCTPETLKKWVEGAVPSKKMQKALKAAGFPGTFYHRRWVQSQFVRAELVQVRNTHWKEGDFEGREWLQKYCVTLRVEKQTWSGRGKARTCQTVVEQQEFLFPTRVSDIINIVSKDEAIGNWQTCQGLSHALGEPVLRGQAEINGVLEPVEKRGSWRLLKAWQKKCLTSEITLDCERSHLAPGQRYTAQQLLDFHERAYLDRNRKRDEAAEFGKRAHQLGEAWLKFHRYQLVDDAGMVRVERIYYPHWFINGGDDPELWYITLEDEPIEVQNALRALEKFIAVNELEIVCTELLLADVALGFAGQVDCIARDRAGNLIFLDWKTSRGVYPTMLMQLVLYARLYWLCFALMCARGYVVRLDKTTAEVEVVPAFEDAEERQELMEAALSAVHLLRWHGRAELKLENLKKERGAKQNG